MTHTDPIIRMAASLSRAQYNVMTSKMYRWEVSAHARTAEVLMKLGLIERTPNHALFETYRFTSHGKKVRAHLMSQKYDQPLEAWSWEND